MISHRQNERWAAACLRGGMVIYGLILLAMVVPRAAGQAAKEGWTEADTRLANQYVQLLYSKPDDPRVLGLLWDHYAGHGETGLLIDYFKRMAGGDLTPSINWYLYAELLRQAGDGDEAERWFTKLVEADEWRALALTGLAHLALEEAEPAEAAEHVERLVATPDLDAEMRREMLESLTSLYVELGESEKALDAWERLLSVAPEDLLLRRRVARQMIAGGYVEKAAEVYEVLRETEDAEVRMQVLLELARLYESANDFEKAVETLNEGRSATHFKHHRHLEFLAMLVRLYESEGRLAELEEGFLAEAAGEGPSEAALYTLVRFYDYTAEPAEREKWLARLVERVPDRGEYLGEYVEALMGNDRYRAAKAQLENMVAEGDDENLAMRFLRVRVELRLHGREAGAGLLREYLADHSLTDDEINEVVQFAEEHFLDDLAGELLLEEREVLGEGAIFRLAELHYSRGRLGEARKVLEEYVEQAADDPELRGERLVKVASVFQGMGMGRGEGARELLERAVELRPEKVAYRLLLAEALAEGKDVDRALEQYEMAWQLSDNDDDRMEADQRLISLLELESFANAKAGPNLPVPLPGAQGFQGINVEELKKRQQMGMSIEDLQAQLARLSGGLQVGEVDEDDRLIKYYLALRSRAEEKPEPAMQFRVAWWAQRLAKGGRYYDYETAYKMLAAFRALNPDHIGAAELMLEIAEATKNSVLQERLLERLIALDPGRRFDYMLARAKLPLDETGHEGEAMERLDEIAAEEGAGPEIREELARVYDELGRIDMAVRILDQAFLESSPPERRRMIEELTRLQIKAGDLDRALDAHTLLIREDPDKMARRKALTGQLRLASREQRLAKLEADYRDLLRRNPLESFYLEALARVLDSMGQFTEAFAMAKKAYYSSRSEDAELLEMLRRLAASSRDVDAAIYYQRQLISQSNSEADVAEWRKLIDMLELNFDVVAADRIRLRLEGKFGNDPEILGELGEHYLRTRQPLAARRLYERMVRLRPWDVRALFTLATLHEFSGDDDEAAELYLEVLRQAEETSRGGGAEGEGVFTHLPLRELSGDGRPEWNNDLRQLDGLVSSLDTIRMIDNRLRVQVATHYLESPRPELQAIPDEPAMLRLRAIEQLGGLVRRAGVVGAARRDWKDFWSEHEPISAEEAFWVAYCSGDWDEAWRLLQGSLFMARPGADEIWSFVERRDWPARLNGPDGQTLTLAELIAQDFIYCLYAVRMNRVEEALAWVEASDETHGLRTNRTMWLLTAVYALARTGEHFVPDESLRKLMESAVFRGEQTSVYHLIQQLSQWGQDLEAYRIAEAAMRHHAKFGEQYNNLLGVLAKRVGDQRGEERYLKAALNQVEPSQQEYWRPVRALADLQESDDDRRKLVMRAMDRLEDVAPDSSAELVRAHLLSIGGDSEGATAAIERLVDIQLGRVRGVDRAVSLAGAGSAAVWTRMLNYANYARMSGLAEEARAPFSEALKHYELLAPRTEEAAERFHQFLQYQLMWEFEGMAFQERKSLLRSYLTLLGEPAGREGFARILAMSQFFRDTIALYGGLLEAQPEDHDVARAFFDACQRSHDYAPALEYLWRVRDGELAAPEGMQEDYFVRQHAYFLWLARDIEQLRVEAKRHEIRVAHTSVEGRRYHDYLARLLVEEGDLEDALAIYEEMDDGFHTNISYLQRHASVLKELDRPEEAVRLLERVKLNGSSPAAEKLAIRGLAPLYAKLGAHDGLMELAGRSVETDDDGVVIVVSEALAEAGMVGEAEDLLLLGSRRAKSDGGRLRLLLELMELAMDGEAAGDEGGLGEGDEGSARLLEMIFACDLKAGGEGQKALLEVLRSAGDRVPAAWGPFLRGLDARGANGLFAAACRLELVLRGSEREGRDGDEVGEIVRALGRARTAEDTVYLKWAIETALAHGRAALAKDLLEIQRQVQPSTLSHAVEAIAVHAAMDDGAALALIYQDLLRDRIEDGLRGRSTMLQERAKFPEAFAKAGQVERAMRLYEHYFTQLDSLRREDRDFYEGYARLLIEEGRYFDAERVLRRAFRKNIDFNVEVLIDLYEDWGRLAALPGALKKFDLSSGLRKKVEFLVRSREREGRSDAADERQAAP